MIIELVRNVSGVTSLRNRIQTFKHICVVTSRTLYLHTVRYHRCSPESWALLASVQELSLFEGCHRYSRWLNKGLVMLFDKFLLILLLRSYKLFLSWVWHQRVVPRYGRYKRFSCIIHFLILFLLNIMLSLLNLLCLVDCRLNVLCLFICLISSSRLLIFSRAL